MLSSSSNPLLLLSSLLLFLFSSPIIASDVAESSNSTTIYELLPKYGLPAGLLPDTVKSYTLADDGAFVVELERPCYIQFDYLVYYDKIITGTLKVGGIHDIKGIEVRRFLVWLGVQDIKVDLPPSDYIYFDVGLITKKLPVDQFRTVHSCKDKASQGGCGIRGIFQIPEPVMEATMLLTE